MASDDSWRIATGADGGKPLVWRIRNQAPPFASRERFPHLLAIQWEYESPNEQGMPSEGAAARMREFEDLLTPAFEGGGQAFLSAIVTGNGVREWQWYASDRKRVMALVNETLGELEPFPVKFMFQDDPAWQAYDGILAAAGEEE